MMVAVLYEKMRHIYFICIYQYYASSTLVFSEFGKVSGLF